MLDHLGYNTEGYTELPEYLFRIHRKKNFSIFPSLAGMSLTKLFLGGTNDVIYKLFPLRESFLRCKSVSIIITLFGVKDTICVVVEYFNIMFLVLQGLKDRHMDETYT